MVTMDFVRTMRPNTSDHALVRIGQVITFVVMVIAVAWAPQIQYFPSLWSYLQSILSYATPPIVAIFLMGIFFQRINAVAAFTTFIVGVVGGLLGFILIEIRGIFDIHFLYAAGISFASSIALLVVISLLTQPQPKEQTDELIWRPALWHAETEELKGKPIWQNYRYLSILLLLSTAIVVGAFW